MAATTRYLLMVCVFIIGRPSLAAFFGEVGGGYRWGSYSKVTQFQNAQTGLGTWIAAGYRFAWPLAIGGALSVAFPQLAPQGGINAAAFQHVAAGPIASYRLRERVEPFGGFLPFAVLRQNSSGAPNSTTGDLQYRGQAWLAGLKYYLNNVQASPRVAISITYCRESYSSLSIETRPPSSGLSTHSFENSDAADAIAGNTYQFGFLVTF